MRTIADVATQPAVTIRPQERLEAAFERLVANEASELYVTDLENRLLGIVPDYELLKARLSGNWLELTVQQVMSPRLLCFTGETPFADALRAFREGQHSRAAVVENGRLIGQITRAALLRSLWDQTRRTMPRPKFLNSELAQNATKLRSSYLG